MANTQSLFITANNKLNKAMPIITPTALITGLILSKYFLNYRFLVIYLFAFLTFSSSLTVSPQQLKTVVKTPKLIFIYSLNNYIVNPLFIVIVSKILFKSNPEIAIGFILLTSIPIAVTSSIWGTIFKGSTALTLSLIIISILLSPILTPLIIKLFISSSIEFDTIGLISSLVKMVLIPSIIGISINYFTKGKGSKTLSIYTSPFSKVALFFVIVINISGVAADLIHNFDILYVYTILTAILFIVSNFVISNFISNKFCKDKESVVSIVLASSLKNISAGLVLAIHFFPPESSIPIISTILMQNVVTSIIGPIIFKTKKQN